MHCEYLKPQLVLLYENKGGDLNTASHLGKNLGLDIIYIFYCKYQQECCKGEETFVGGCPDHLYC